MLMLWYYLGKPIWDFTDKVKRLDNKVMRKLACVAAT